MKPMVTMEGAISAWGWACEDKRFAAAARMVTNGPWFGTELIHAADDSAQRSADVTENRAAAAAFLRALADALSPEPGPVVVSFAEDGETCTLRYPQAVFKTYVACSHDILKLPCDVRVAPATTINAGCSVANLLGCIEDRVAEGRPVKFQRQGEWWKAEISAAPEPFKATWGAGVNSPKAEETSAKA